MNGVTEQEFRRAIWSNRIYFTAHGVQRYVQISRKEALRLFEEVEGDIAWYTEGKDIVLVCNAVHTYGHSGDLRA